MNKKVIIGLSVLFILAALFTACKMAEDLVPTYTVYFDPNGGTGNMAEQTLNYGMSQRLRSIADIGFTHDLGYEFVGWAETPSGDVIYTDKQIVTNLTETESKTLFARWGWNIEFMTGTSSSNFEKYVFPGGTVSQPQTPTRTGYNFVNWYDADPNIPSANIVTFPINITSHLILYAKWSETGGITSCKVTFLDDKNGNKISDVDVLTGTQLELPTDPTRPNNKFIGWYTEEDFLYAPTTVVTKSFTLYAKWVSAYTVTFSKNNTDPGSIEADPQVKAVVAPATTVVSLPTQPTRTGWTFNNWNTQENGSGAVFTAATVVNSSITVFAQWVQNLTGSVTINNTSPVVGSFLSASYVPGNGTGIASWEWLRDDAVIAPGSTYTVVSADLGVKLKARVSWSGQNGSITSDATNAVGNQILTGTVTLDNYYPIVGNQITATYSGGNGTGTTTWQWFRDDDPISGTNNRNYTAVATDVGKQLKARVSYTGQSGSVTSEPTDTVIYPALTGLISISNTSPVVGDVLTAFYQPGNGAGTALWQWLRNDGIISGATGSTYTVVSDDLGSTLKARVTYSERSGSVTSSATTQVFNPILTGTVTISNTNPAAGDTLIATYVPGNGTGFASWQWLKDDTVIPGASSNQYTVLSGDVGSVLKARVSYIGQSGYVTSNGTNAVINALLTGTVNISGSAVVGQTLTANTGGLGGSGSISYQWKRDGLNIGSATGSTYVLVSADVGYQITVTVTRSGSSGSQTSAPTATVGYTGLTGTLTISGNAVVGQTLTANASLNGSGTITYQWKRGSTDTGSNSNTYTVLLADYGQTITVTATRSDTSGSLTSAPTSSVAYAALTGTPTITGTATVGQTLTAGISSLQNATGIVSYQWKRGGIDISGATSSSYTLVIADYNNVITVTISYSQNSNSVTSAATSAVAYAALTGTVSISGTATVGQTLTASITGHNGTGTISYQWSRGSSNIGTGSQYTLVLADYNSAITVTVTYTQNTGSLSATSSTVAYATLGGSVSISGTTTVGYTLTANINLQNATGTINYQWRRGGSNISGATASTYTLVNADQGYAMTVYVTCTQNSGGVTSSATAAVAYPTLTGTVSLGSTTNWVRGTLTATISGSNAASGFSYQWRRNGSNISQTTVPTYTIVDADRNQNISVVVSCSGFNGTMPASNNFAVSNNIGITNQAELSDMNANSQYILANDITITGNWAGKVTGQTSGQFADRFYGRFDGNSKTITFSSVTMASPRGLFYGIGAGAEVKNFKIQGLLQVTGTGVCLGAVANFNDGGTIQNVASTVEIYATSTSDDSYIGGIVGTLSSGTIKNCRYSGYLTAKNTNARYPTCGGIAGENTRGTISYCWTEGSYESNEKTVELAYAGGIVGTYFYPQEASITNCVALGYSIYISAIDSWYQSNVIGRIYGSYGQETSTNYCTNNFANSSMGLVIGTTLVTTTPVGINTKNGANVTIAETQVNNDGTWWQRTGSSGPGWTTGTNWGGSGESRPWKLSNGSGRPVLWFE